ncbi:MAG: HipA family kinase [Clostridium sp.]
MRKVGIETFLKPMGAGITRPALVLGDDYNEYIIKNEKVDDNGTIVKYDCMFVNELLAYQIGLYLGVPMPEAVIAIVEGDLIEDDPTARFAYRFEKGKYYATERLKNLENNLMQNYQQLINMGKPYISKSWKKFFGDIINKDDVSKIIAFDIFIANFDRYDNIGNILIDTCTQRKIYAIDHGHSFFGPFWNNDKMNCLGLKSMSDDYIIKYTDTVIDIMNDRQKICGSGTIFNALEEYIDLTNIGKHSFQDVIYKIEKINEKMIQEWADNIPNEWYTSKEFQIAYYESFIMKQKNVVKNIIQELASRRAFTNYRGGILEWRNQEEESHIV